MTRNGWNNSQNPTASVSCTTTQIRRVCSREWGRPIIPFIGQTSSGLSMHAHHGFSCPSPLWFLLIPLASVGPLFHYCFVFLTSNCKLLGFLFFLVEGLSLTWTTTYILVFWQINHTIYIYIFLSFLDILSFFNYFLIWK